MFSLNIAFDVLLFWILMLSFVVLGFALVLGC